MAEHLPTIESVDSDERWDELLSPLPNAHFLQSGAWLQFKGDYGWTAHRYRLRGANGDLGYAGVLTRRLARVFTVAYVPRGPLLVEPGRASLDQVLACLEPLARRNRWLLLKVDPEIWDDEATTWAQPTLRARGWRPGEEVQFRNTVQLPLTGTDDDILAAMKPKTRYNVRLATRRGVTVRPLAVEELPFVYDLYRRTALRDGFIVRPRSYYQQLWGSLMGAGMAVVLGAELQDRLLAALVAVAYGRTCWYFHGASQDEGRTHMPTYLLQWEAMRWGRARGCTTYDLWGAPEALDDPDHPMAGVLRFKLGFGGQVREGLGAWDYAPSPLLYRLYGIASTAALSLGRAHRRRTQQHE